MKPCSASPGEPALNELDLGGLRLYVLDGGSMTFDVEGAERTLTLTLALRPILLQADGFSCLVDPAFGPADPARRDKFRLQDPAPLEEQCAALGLPDGPDLVYLSHLHFDHAAGALAGSSSSPPAVEKPRFANAAMWVHAAEWREAMTERRGGDLAARIAGAFTIEASRPRTAGAHGALTSVDAEQGVVWERDELALRFERTRGHTGGLCVLWCHGREQSALFAADLLPSRRFLKPRLDRVADLDPERARDERQDLLARAAERDAWVCFFHDPGCALARIRPGSEGFELVETR